MWLELQMKTYSYRSETATLFSPGENSCNQWVYSSFRNQGLMSGRKCETTFVSSWLCHLGSVIRLFSLVPEWIISQKIVPQFRCCSKANVGWVGPSRLFLIFTNLLSTNVVFLFPNVVTSVQDRTGFLLSSSSDHKEDSRLFLTLHFDILPGIALASLAFTTFLALWIAVEASGSTFVARRVASRVWRCSQWWGH